MPFPPLYTATAQMKVVASVWVVASVQTTAQVSLLVLLM
jgi:hypothetical protein